ncbi:transglycosylase domain-containing protein [Pseudalkalibacillus salsuginis]|uniref:transglycosylase domain-containing protein n=1 Tax=Pseudalkalibacillus salsuginis TaxID=2910972 RepID=UPI001F4502CA|nr:PBP1A family penicillin-binding protein [Pseudalkalibacillus salsuginis]MCF6410877.1 PBP1A family penicillin-binding protein [Pseudalkalibacillus salsuginis]
MEVITADRLLRTWKVVWLYLRTLLIFSLPLFLIGLIFVVVIHVMGPPPLKVPQTTVFYGSDESIIGEHEPLGQNRFWVKLEDISPYMTKATVAVEDRKFYRHHGFDLKRIGAALLADIRAGSKVQGASTITQQYSRNLFLAPDKTWERKLKEAVYAARIEANYTKDEIIQGYLNTIYYGHGNYGIEAASQFYFGKPAKKLNLAEASMLAGIPKGPSYYSPIANMDNAKKRQKIVLNAMVATGAASAKEAAEAYKAPLEIVGKTNLPVEKAAYFQDEVEYLLKNKLGLDAEEVKLGGYHVYTTLDPELQEKAEHWVEKSIPKTSSIQVGMAALDPRTGDVKAMVGGRDYQKSAYNRATQARRAPGSTFKPFLYAAALKNGFTPSTLLKSEPTTFFKGEENEYIPENFGNHYANDEITLAQAIAVSDNVYAVKTNIFIGPEQLVKTARDFGIKSDLSAIPSLALGTKPVGVLEMTSAYSVFANNGVKSEPRFITKVVDYKGDVIYEQDVEKKRVIDQEYAYVMTDLMKGVFDERLNDYTRVTGASISSLIDRPTAGKTGSTNNDNWIIGYTPQLVTGVWTGYDKGKSLHPFNDVLYSKNIWGHFMKDAMSGRPVAQFTQPEGVIGVNVNPDTGLLASDSCSKKRLSYYIEGTQPTKYCKGDAADKEKAPISPNQTGEKGFFKQIWKWIKG